MNLFPRGQDSFLQEQSLNYQLLTDVSHQHLTRQSGAYRRLTGFFHDSWAHIRLFPLAFSRPLATYGLLSPVFIATGYLQTSTLVFARLLASYRRCSGNIASSTLRIASVVLLTWKGLETNPLSRRAWLKIVQQPCHQ